MHHEASAGYSPDRHVGKILREVCVAGRRAGEVRWREGSVRPSRRRFEATRLPATVVAAVERPPGPAR